MTTNQQSFLTRQDLENELSAAHSSLDQHLDAVCAWSTGRPRIEEPALEHHLTEIRYWATTVRTVSRLLEAEHR